MNPEELAEHILKNYDQATEPEAMKEAIAHVIKSNHVIRNNLHAVIDIRAEETTALRAAAYEAMLLLEKLSRVNGWYGDEQRVYDLLRSALA